MIAAARAYNIYCGQQNAVDENDVQLEPESDSDDDWMPDFTEAEEDELRRTRFTRLSQNILLLAAYCHVMGAEFLGDEAEREVWVIDRHSDLFYDMVHFWPGYSPGLQKKLYLVYIPQVADPQIPKLPLKCLLASRQGILLSAQSLPAPP